VVDVRTGLAGSLAALLLLLAALEARPGLATAAWGVGLACGIGGGAAVAHGLARHGARLLGPADLVTLARAVLACGVAALVAEAFVGEPATRVLVTLSVAALALDFVDGRVARLTRTATPFGARFDGEADAFLILVLSVHVARWAGAWVLLIGAARYAFAVAGWVLPWMWGRLPYRYWRKVVAAVQGIVLTYAAAEVGPPPAAYAALVVAVALLAESFGRDVLWLWRHREPAPVVAAATGRLRVRQP
jgi:phosphatidylglycerophosphate synthase